MAQYLSVKQVAERYSVSAPTVWRWAQANNFPQPVRITGNCTRWRMVDIEAWEKSRFGGAA
ncbi:helix-turn-helix transcriptional regulator [Thalassospira lohafexi]|uniref:AlpA family transcriptional regulator n=1 Tax=Thalassospira lohafexi TaxID=744227 RepID=A0A2N3LBC6_9PROT|nr:AlpA family transcriptional regulator [Thalassospira lohafexi]